MCHNWWVVTAAIKTWNGKITLTIYYRMNDCHITIFSLNQENARRQTTLTLPYTYINGCVCVCVVR